MEGRLTGRVYGTILEVLSTGLYPNKLDVLREYVQNAYDGIKAARRAGIEDTGRVDIRIVDDGLVIHDDGHGIEGGTIFDFGAIGASNKYDPGDTGFRGIGRLAGICAADELAFVTKVKGERIRHLVRFRAGDMIRENDESVADRKRIPLESLIEKYGSIQQSPEREEKHYTTVILKKINKNSNVLLDEQQIDRYVAEIAPVDFSPSFRHGTKIREFLVENVPNLQYVQVYVNNVRVVKPFTDEVSLNSLRFFKIEDRRDRVIAVCWSLMNTEAGQIPDDLVAGLRLRIKGMGIGPPTYVEDILAMTQPTLFYWFCGEIHVTDDECKPSSDRNQLVHNEARNVLYRELKQKLGGPLERDARRASGESAVQKRLTKGRQLLEDSKSVARRALTSEKKEAEVEKLIKQMEKIDRALDDDEVTKQVQKQAKEILAAMQQQVQVLRSETKDLDVSKTLGLSGEASRIFSAFVESAQLALRREFGFAPKKVADIVQAISEEFMRRWKRK